MKKNINGIMTSTDFSRHVKDLVSLFARSYNFNIDQIKQVNKNSKESTIEKELLKAMVTKIRMSFKAYFLLIKDGFRYDSFCILKNIF